MEENQNDSRNMQSGTGSNQQSPDGKNKETNPNNPTANKGTQQGSQSGNQQRSGTVEGSQSGGHQRQGSTSAQGSNTDVEDTEESDEITQNGETSGERTTGNSDSERGGPGTGKQNSKRENM